MLNRIIVLICVCLPLSLMASYKPFEVEQNPIPSAVEVMGFWLPISYKPIRASHGAKIKAIYQSYGVNVNHGDNLFELEDANFMLETQEAALQVDVHEAKVKTIEHWHLSSECLDAKRDLELAKTECRARQVHRDETQKLVDLGGLPREALVQDEMQLERAYQHVKSAQNRLHHVKEKGSEQAYKGALLELAKAKLNHEKLKLQLEAFSVTAPSNGTFFSPELFFKTDANPVAVGEHVDTNQPLGVIASLDDFGVVFDIEDALMDTLEEADALEVQLKGETIAASLISAQPNQLTRDANQPAHYKVQLKLEVLPKGYLRLGQKVIVRIKKSLAVNTVRVPIHAIQWQDNHAYVYKYDGANYQLAQVELGKIGDEWAQVAKGLNKGDIIGITS